jgi:hypothetical protein
MTGKMTGLAHAASFALTLIVSLFTLAFVLTRQLSALAFVPAALKSGLEQRHESCFLTSSVALQVHCRY